MVVIEAPFPGMVSSVLVKIGDSVKEDDELLVLEAMKMQNPIVASADGKVKEIKVRPNEEVDTGQHLMVID